MEATAEYRTERNRSCLIPNYPNSAVLEIESGTCFIKIYWNQHDYFTDDIHYLRGAKHIISKHVAQFERLSNQACVEKSGSPQLSRAMIGVWSII